MTKLISSLAFAITLAFSLTGCELYFGGDDNDYDSDGRPPSSGSGGGWTCDADADCAAGCFCAVPDAGGQGYCEEAGFCSEDTDCPTGYTCDDRSSCVPDPGPTCTTDAECAAGSYCEDGSCVPSCVCSTDAEAQAAGWGFCDETRGTCEPTSATGSCSGAVTCTTAAPSCAAGEVPLVLDGCYTGACNTIATCDVTPTCQARQHETDCLGVTGCGAVYTGINCTKPDGSACQTGDTGCTCASFQFNSCTTQTSPRTVFDTLGNQINASSSAWH